ncbi:MAG TPA: hypothetical protein VGK61_10790 [Planctomycetota bacterium]
MTYTLNCPKCGRRNVLSEDDAVLFYPRFFCLSCGTRLMVPLSTEEYLKKLRDPDRDRRIRLDGKAAPPPAPVKPAPQAATPGDAG